MKLTDEQILKKAIERAKKNGWDNAPAWDDNVGQAYYSDGDGGFFVATIKDIIFSHDFAKAFWGEKIMSYEIKCISGVYELYNLPEWQYELQQIILQEEPLKYLEKFL